MPHRALALLFTLLLAPALPARGQEPAAALLLWMEGLLPTLPRIAGQVVTGDGVPVEGALVQASRHPEREERTTLTAAAETDRQGRFLLVPVVGTHNLEVTAPGFLRARVQGLAVSPGRPVAELTVRLLPGAVLAGRVLDEAGAPIAGARVLLADVDGSALETLSDPAGHYRLNGIDPGEHEVSIHLEADHASLPRVRIARGENRLDLPFVRRGFRGRVLSPEGEPVAGAEVRISGIGGEHTATTGVDGVFAFRMVVGWARLDVKTAGYVPYRSRPLRIDGAAAQEIEVRLTRGGTLRGRVSGIPDGERPTIRVSAANYETQERGSTSVADALGRYQILGLGPGTWQVTASADGRWISGEATLRPGASEARLDLTFPAYWPVRGRVLDGNGTPVEEALVFLHDGAGPQGSARSDADGTFSLQLPDGTYEVMAEREGYAPMGMAEPVTVAGAAAGDVEIRLAAETRLTGRVLGLTPEELAETTVTARQQDIYSSDPSWFDDRDGSYAFEHLSPGDWVVSACRGGELAEARLHVAPGETDAKLDLTFVRGDLTLRGALHGGDPLANYVAELSRYREGELDEGPRTSAPDRQGVFQFTRLRPGRYRLEIQDANLVAIGGRPAYDRVIELAQDQELEIELPAAPEEASPP